MALKPLAIQYRGRISAVQTWLNILLSPSPSLTVNGSIDHPTKEAIKRWQQMNGISVNGELNGPTWRAFGRMLGNQINVAEALAYTGQNVLNVMFGRPLVQMRYQRDSFFSDFMAHPQLGGGLDRGQIAGLNLLLHFIEQDSDVTDHRWAAYMLATVMNECARTWQPIAEGNCNDVRGCTPIPGTRRAEYGRPRACPSELLNHLNGQRLTSVTVCPAGRITHTYYGRGYIQITWPLAYKKFGDEVGEDLLHHPEKALEPAVAYKIMNRWMVHGSAMHYGLSRYINATKTDYFNARKIIAGNALDNNEHLQVHARIIARWAEAIDTILIQSLI